MYYKKFHKYEISALGIGSLRLPAKCNEPNIIDRQKAQKVLDHALECGINYIDTAYTYHNGDSERFLGEALEKYPRDSYYLASKFYVAANPDIECVFEDQLKRLKTDYLDFYLLHGVDENSIDAFMDKGRDYIGFLEKQKKAGRIRYYGFSSHAAPETLTRFLTWHDKFDMALIQLNYLDWDLLDAKMQYEILTEHHIPIWVMEPLKGGRLSTLNQKAADILKTAAPDRSLSSWAFRFLMGLPNVQTVLSGMASITQVQDNVKTFGHCDPLNEKEYNILRSAKAVFMDDLGVPCSGCRYCCEYCPAKLDIPLLIKGYNEQKVSGELWRIAEISNLLHGPKDCQQCGRCMEHCPQKIDIPAVMQSMMDTSQ